MLHLTLITLIIHHYHHVAFNPNSINNPSLSLCYIKQITHYFYIARNPHNHYINYHCHYTMLNKISINLQG